MKYHFTILQSFFIVFSFIVLTSALVIDKRSVELVINSKLPTITYHFQKRDLIDLHHSGSKTTTTTTTATSKPQSTPEPSVVPSSNPGKKKYHVKLFTLYSDTITIRGYIRW